MMKKKLYLILLLAEGFLMMAFLLNPLELWAQGSFPVARCHDITVYIDAAGSPITIDPNDVDDGSSDADGPIVYKEVTPSIVGCDNVGFPVAVTLVVGDADGNMDDCIAYVTVVDPLGPSVVPREVTLYLNESGQAHLNSADELIDYDFTHDNCGLWGAIASRMDFNCADIGYPEVTVEVLDVNGNSTTMAAWIQVVDDLPPTPICKDITITLDASGQAELDPVDVDGGTTDNCWTPMLMLSDYDFNCEDVGTQMVTLFARDETLISSCTAWVTVVDHTPPIANCFASIDIFLDEEGTAMLTPAYVDAGSYDVCGIGGRSIDGSQYFNCTDVTTSPHQVTLVVLDNSGNEGRCSVDVYIRDDDPPSITCPPDITVETDPGICRATSVDLGEAIVTDNCSAFAENNAPDYYPLGDTDVWWQAIDGENIPATCKQTVTIVDNEPPVLSGCPEDLTVTCMTDAPAQATVTATDNCSSTCPVTFTETESDPGNTCYNVITRIWSSEDIAMNQASCTQIITVRDDIPPVIICAPDAVKSSNPGECTYTAVGDEFDAAATDDCNNLDPLTWELTGATSGSGTATLAGVAFNFGVTTVKWTAEDDCGNLSTCEMFVDVNKIITITGVTVEPTSQQYSDPVTFTATIQPGFCEGAGQAATHVTFFVGIQSMGEPVPLELDGGLLVGTATYPMLEEEGYEGSMDPDPALNPKLVTATFSGIDPDFEVEDATTNLTILPEDACAYYAGVYYASTGSALVNEATVVLAVSIVEEEDGYPGDFLNKAFVQFYSDGSLIATVPVEMPVGEIGAGPAIGTASFEWTGVPIGVYEITVKVLGYYENPDSDCDGYALVTVGKPTPDFITGGGYVTLENSMGLIAGTPGLKNNFGFVVKYNKRMTNIQGNLNTTIRRVEADGLHFYKVRSTALTSLAINGNQATFTGKASIQDLTYPHNNGIFAGNNLLQFTMTDNGEPGSSDLISITVWKNDGGMWFTTLWDDVAYRPAEQFLNAGNLVVHSAATDGGEGTKPPKKKSAEILTTEDYTFKIFPNPFSDRLYFDFSSPSDVTSRLEIFDASGRKIKILFEDKMLAGQFYRIEYEPKNQVTQMLIYRMTMGDHIINGKVLYKK